MNATHRCILWFGLLLCTAWPCAAEDRVDFARDIQPILAAHCTECHGPERTENGLRWDRKSTAMLPADSGKTPIVPGDVAGSRIIAVIAGTDGELFMPPKGKGKPLSKPQIEMLTRWVRQGADWPEQEQAPTHWSFIAPKQPALPAVRDEAWVRTPIDRFVLAKLEAAGLKPNPPADQYTLLRRVYLDLIGVPPTPEQVDAFVRDASPDAYEKVVDALLQSPKYGEKWARLWLDLARFADTKGYEKDLNREGMYRYRDWVIEALSADMPFDQFTIEQLAGDLLPNATPEQILATAFHRNTMSNDEGGTDDEEFRVAAVKDRVDTTLQVWMGLTAGCAQCHSHKYDPITIREYYQFYAFFNQTEDADRFDDQPLRALPSREQELRNQEIDATVARLQGELYGDNDEADEAQRQWERSVLEASPWRPLRGAVLTSEADTTLAQRADASVFATGKHEPKDVYRVNVPVQDDRTITAVRVEILADPSLPQNGPGRSGRDPNMVLSEFTLSIADQPVKFATAQSSFDQIGWPVAKAIDGDPATGWALAGGIGRDQVAIFTLAEPLRVQAGQELRFVLSQQYGAGLTIGRFRIAVTDAADAKLDMNEPRQAIALLTIPAADRTPEQAAEVRKQFRDYSPMFAAVRERIEQTGKQKVAPPNVPIMRELPANKRRVTYLQTRGDFLSKGEALEPAVPAVFGKLPEGAPANRLGAAQWLVGRDNPLTARVAVNRHWAAIFGLGIVETEEDFGTQGLEPSHPELLDWLAVHFMENSAKPWSMKQLCKTIVMSNTYQQSSQITEEKRQADPRNQLLSRGPRFRLSAEMVRDQALTAAGLLSDKMYGPSVMPPQPDGIWASTYNALSWVTSPGENRYRRGVYTFIKRTSPYPSMMTFDGTSREVCTVRRIRTNTPLQALIMLNDPVYVEAAQALARRAAEKAGADVRQRIAYAFRAVATRPANDAELDVLEGLYQRRAEYFRTQPSEAEVFATDPLGDLPAGMDAVDAAAMTAVCNVLLNLDEILMKG